MTASGEYPLLTTAERAILIDTASLETSQELFDRVRREAVDLYASANYEREEDLN